LASNTPRLGLYKKDPVIDANDTFNITTMLNDNWDRIDQNVETIAGAQAKADTAKAEAIAACAQNAFATIKVGTTNIDADNKADTLELVAGTGITLTPDAANDKVTIAVQLKDDVTSTSTTQAATANAVKIAYERAEYAEINAIAEMNRFGLGIDAPYINNCNVLSSSGDTGFYKVDMATLNTPFPGASAGVLIHVGRSGTPAQIFIDFAYNRMFTRTYGYSGWSSWQLLATKSDLEAVWLTLALQNGVQAYNTNTTPKYCKIGDMVFLKGWVKGIATAGTIIGTLPSGYRPVDHDHYYIQATNQSSSTNSTFARWYIRASDGAIIVDGVNSEASFAPDKWFSIDTVFIAG
jgi:hypothetical protein